VNVALPALVRQIGITTSDLQWVVDAYNLVFAALILAAGSLSDRPGRRGMLLAGLAVFGAASLVGSLATTTRPADRGAGDDGAGRGDDVRLDAVAAAQRVHRPPGAGPGHWPVGRQRWGGDRAGPVAGGWLLERFWWGSIFLFMVPIAA
jgi:MFS family permease